MIIEDRKTILVVDDVALNIDVLNGILGDEYNIKAAISGEKALKAVKTGTPPDMILLDIMMPGMDGYEVCRILKNDPHTNKIPIIFVTGRNDVIDEERGFAMGAVDYITKPVSPPIVRARIRTHIMLYDQNIQLEVKVRERTSELHETRLEIIRRLGRAAEYRDNETGFHVIRMSKISRQIALAYGMDTEEADLILNASPMHDIGKIGIPDYILLKASKLSPEEWEIMKTHAAIGGTILGDHNSEIMSAARTAALSHHEKWDGSGYPEMLAGEHIPLIGRITAIADVFDALTSERPYKKAWPLEEAYTHIIAHKGSHFDPALVEAFVNSFADICRIKEELPDE
jgi:putative two-component system response regulator